MNKVDAIVAIYVSIERMGLLDLNIESRNREGTRWKLTVLSVPRIMLVTCFSAEGLFYRVQNEQGKNRMLSKIIRALPL